MIDLLNQEDHRGRMLRAGLPRSEAEQWLDAMKSALLPDQPKPDGLESDAKAFGPLIARGRAFCEKMPLRSKRTSAERDAGESIVLLMASLCRRFCSSHRESMYRKLTNDYSRLLRVDELAWRAGDLWPGLLPGRGEVAREAERMQRDKDGLEFHQGIFFSQIFAGRESGHHLLHAMLRPKAESLELLSVFRRDGVVDLDRSRAEVRGGAGYVITNNPGFLNAEDDSTNGPQETAIDLVLLHPELQIGILRGERVEHPRYKGRRVFDSGINLTHLYHGKISYLFYLIRDLGLVNKLFRGLTHEEWEMDAPEATLEKPWLAVVERHAIGGGCQLLLVVDYVIAESGSYFNLPARKEGIIPGAANLRLSRFLGERLARQAILFDKTFHVESPEAAGLINEVVPGDELEQAIQRFVDNARSSGMVSASGNRKALRVQVEPLEVYRRYLAAYCEEQARCHLSDQLIANLETHWGAKDRRL
ncbi:MAG: enoyl-CoA hydratase/isomerase family protein [bacterium]